MESTREEERGQNEANFEELLRKNVSNAGINTNRTSITDTNIQPASAVTDQNYHIHSEGSQGNSVDTENITITKESAVRLCNQTNETVVAVGDTNSTASRSRCFSVIGAILRIMGDEQYCRTCGKHLRVMGDEIYCMYAARKLISPLLQELNYQESVIY